MIFHVESEKNVPPVCPKCMNNRQVWLNQLTGLLTCHRAYCDTVIPTKVERSRSEESRAKLDVMLAGQKVRLVAGDFGVPAFKEDTHEELV